MLSFWSVFCCWVAVHLQQSVWAPLSRALLITSLLPRLLPLVRSLFSQYLRVVLKFKCQYFVFDVTFEVHHSFVLTRSHVINMVCNRKRFSIPKILNNYKSSSRESLCNVIIFNTFTTLYLRHYAYSYCCNNWLQISHTITVIAIPLPL